MPVAVAAVTGWTLDAVVRGLWAAGAAGRSGAAGDTSFGTSSERAADWLFRCGVELEPWDAHGRICSPAQYLRLLAERAQERATTIRRTAPTASSEGQEPRVPDVLTVDAWRDNRAGRWILITPPTPQTPRHALALAGGAVVAGGARYGSAPVEFGLKLLNFPQETPTCSKN